MNDLIPIFYESAAECGLHSVEGPNHAPTSDMSHLGTLSTSDGSVTINVRILMLFDETVVFIVSCGGRNSPFQLKLPRKTTEPGGWCAPLDVAAIKRYLRRIVFGPIVRPATELPALAHLSTGLLINILGFAEAADLCSVGLANRRFCCVCKEDALWSDLLRRGECFVSLNVSCM